MNAEKGEMKKEIDLLALVLL